MKLGQPNNAVEGEFKKLEETKTKDQGIPGSKLEPELQSLISFIFDEGLISQSVVSIGYDVKRLPLGQLEKETVLEGYKYLREIEKVLNNKSKGDLADLSSKFYTHIPHNFSMKHMSNFIINTHEKLLEKLDLIQNLVDINIAKNIVSEKRKK
jgi:poly [ADP-ribose] polymerase